MMQKAIQSRHSVRNYLDQPILESALTALNKEIVLYNQKAGLHIQLMTNEPKAFGSFMGRYGKFTGVKNYIALIGKKSEDLDEVLGYYGEALVLKAQMLGLNTCWVAVTFSKGKSPAVINKGEKLVSVITLGYGKTQGVPHKSKPMDTLCQVKGEMPKWFIAGMESAMLAPTAINQQKFLITLDKNTVQAKATGGFYSRVDLGIVKYHFEVGAGTENFAWK